MDLCDLHEDCEAGDDEYNEICGEDSSEQSYLHHI